MDHELLHTFLLQYASLQSIPLLKYPPPLLLAKYQDWLVKNLVQNPKLVDFPPAQEYQIKVYKELIRRLEKGVEELGDDDVYVDDAFYEGIANAMAPPQTLYNSGVGPSASHKTFFYPSPKSLSPPIRWSTISSEVWEDSVTLLEEQKTIQSGTTGLRTWGASLRLAEFLLLNPQYLAESTRVLELGSGVGFLGLFTASLMGSTASIAPSPEKKTMWLTDVDSKVLEDLEHNVELNGFIPNKSDSLVHIRKVDWEDSLPTADDGHVSCIRSSLARIDPQLIIAADVVYDHTIIPALVSTLSLLLHRNTSSTALICSTVRNSKTILAFTEACGASEMLVEDVVLPEINLPGKKVFWGCSEGGSLEPQVRLMKLSVLA